MSYDDFKERLYEIIRILNKILKSMLNLSFDRQMFCFNFVIDYNKEYY
jgi:hypothetical protein